MIIVVEIEGGHLSVPLYSSSSRYDSAPSINVRKILLGIDTSIVLPHERLPFWYFDAVKPQTSASS